jgi:hypothetical protein
MRFAMTDPRLTTSDDDFNFEPVPGLPARLPKGEDILWQGRPDWRALARDAYATRWIAAYFAVIVLWRATVGFQTDGLRGVFAFGLPYVGLGLLAIAVLSALAWAQAKATIYTVTTARVVMRVGAALSVTFNIPYRQIATARLDDHGATGTIALETMGDTRIAWLVLWPHVRPWHIARTEPALRCIPEAGHVARLIAEAAETRLAQPVIARVDTPAADPSLVAAE